MARWRRRLLLGPYRVRSLVRRWPFRGRYRLARLLGLTVDTLPEGDIVEVDDGRRFAIYRDAMYWRLFLEGSYNRAETAYFRRVIEEGDTVVDVGANFGWYATVFAQQVGPDGCVHAFEPSPTVFGELERQLRLNRHLAARIRPNNFALGREAGALTLHQFAGLPHGHASLSDLGRDDATATEVEVRRLDDYLDERGLLAEVDVVKCDVEGAELMVLEGATRLLQSSHPPLWLLEMNDQTARSFGHVPSDLLHYLADIASYDRFLASRSGRLVELKRPEDYRHGQTILCARLDVHGGRLARTL